VLLRAGTKGSEGMPPPSPGKNYQDTHRMLILSVYILYTALKIRYNSAHLQHVNVLAKRFRQPGTGCILLQLHKIAG